MIYPPPAHPSTPHPPTLSPYLSPICFPLLCLIYLRGTCTMWHRCWCDLHSLSTTATFVSHNSSFLHISLPLSCSIHPSIQLSHAVYFFLLIYWGEDVIWGRARANIAKCNIPLLLSMLVNHFIYFCTHCSLLLCLSHVDLVRGGCDDRISFYQSNPAILITTSHHLRPAEFIINGCHASPLLFLFNFLAVSLLNDPPLKFLTQCSSRQNKETPQENITCEIFLFICNNFNFTCELCICYVFAENNTRTLYHWTMCDGSWVVQWTSMNNTWKDNKFVFDAPRQHLPRCLPWSLTVATKGWPMLLIHIIHYIMLSAGLFFHGFQKSLIGSTLLLIPLLLFFFTFILTSSPSSSLTSLKVRVPWSCL